jgi:hypothetical protein
MLNMASLIPGYEYDIFISYRQKKEPEMGREGEGEKGILRIF